MAKRYKVLGMGVNFMLTIPTSANFQTDIGTKTEQGIRFGNWYFFLQQ